MDRDETFLVLRAQSGDLAALDELLRRVQEPLFRHLRRLLDDRAQAEDALQELFLRIHRKLAWLDDPALFRPWAYRIATRLAYRMLQRDRRWRQQVRDEEVLASLADAAPPPVVDVSRLIGRVTPASRAVLVLHYLDEMPLDEVAAVLEIPLGTVKSRLAYGLSTLRRILEGADER